MDKGTVSNILSGVTLALGLTLRFLAPGAAADLILSAGLFALSGGVTNSLAVKMLFDRIPGLVGSGVIQTRFREIRAQMKRLIMTHFFSEDDLRRFLEQRQGQIEWTRYVDLSDGGGPVAFFVESQWDRFASPDAIGPLVSSQVDKLMDSAFGGLLHMVGKSTVEDVVGKFVYSFADEMKVKVLEASATFDYGAVAREMKLDTEAVVADLRTKVDDLLEQKLAELDAARIKRMMEEVMREHLGWLVVWGNVFGGAIGIAAYFLQSF